MLPTGLASGGHLEEGSVGWTTAPIAAVGLSAMTDPGPLPPPPSFLSPLTLGSLQPAGLPGFPGV